MKLTADRDQLALAVTRAAQGLPLNPVIPVRAGMLLQTSGDHVHLTCADEDVTFVARMPLLEEAEDGSCILPGKLLTEMVRYLPQQQVIIDVQDHQAVFTCGRSSFTVRTKPGSEYPWWAASPAPLCRLDADVLAAGLRKVAAAAGPPDSEPPVLAAILLRLDGTLALVATDRFKLGMMELPAVPLSATSDPAETKVETLLPARVAERFARACEGEATVGWDDALISLHSEGLLVTARQIAWRDEEGNIKFPKWESVMGGEHTWFACVTAELIRAVKMASLAADDDRIELAFSECEIAVTAGGNACQVVECGYDGEPVTLAVGGRNLLAGLAGCGELVRLAPQQGRKPFLMDSDGLHWLVQTREMR